MITGVLTLGDCEDLLSVLRNLCPERVIPCLGGGKIDVLMKRILDRSPASASRVLLRGPGPQPGDGLFP